MKTIKFIFLMVIVAMTFTMTGCKKYDSSLFSKDGKEVTPTPVPPTPTGSENLRYERDGNKSLAANAIVDGQTLNFTGKGINTFFYLEDQTGNALNGNFTITQTVGGNAYYAKSAIDQVMYNFPNDGDYTVVVAGTNNGNAFSHTFYVHVGTAVIPNPSNVPVRLISNVQITGGWQITMRFFLTPGGLGTAAAPFGYAWVNEFQTSLYDHLPLTFAGDSATAVFNIMNTSNNLYYTNNNGSRFKFNYLIKQQAGNGTAGLNGQWAAPSGNFFANNATGAGSMFEFYINLTSGVITLPGGQVFNPGTINFNMPGKVGDNIFRAEKVGTTMYFYSLYPTNLLSSVNKKAQYKIGASGTWTNFPSNPTQFGSTDFFGCNIAYSTVSGVGDVFIRFGEEVSGVFTINPNAISSPSFDSVAGGFSFR